MCYQIYLTFKDVCFPPYKSTPAFYINCPRLTPSPWKIISHIHFKNRYVLIEQLCLTLCNPMDCSPPVSSVHGILQARILQWVTVSSFRGSSRPWDRTWSFPHCRQIVYRLSHQGSTGSTIFPQKTTFKNPQISFQFPQKWRILLKDNSAFPEAGEAVKFKPNLSFNTKEEY